VLGWLVALPVPLLVGLAPSWSFIVAANILLGGPHGGLGRRLVIAAVGLFAAIVFVRDTAAHVAVEQRAHATTAEPLPSLAAAFRTASVEHPVLRACNQAGLVNNLNDALAWGLTPLYLAAHGSTVREIAIVAAAYPVVWGLGQLLTGWASDHVGRKPLISAGMLVQAVALGILVAGGGSFRTALPAAVLLGVGTAMVYPTLIAAVSDVTQPRERARIVGVYRFWRDFGFAVGALAAGILTDLVSADAAIGSVAALTAASGLIVARTPWGDPTQQPGSAGRLAPAGVPRSLE
jgi:Na+/melibiose symporter-like transporter